MTNLNENPCVHGIIVQMPLDTSGESGQIDPHLITNAVLDSKDVDGLSVVNQVLILFQVWLLNSILLTFHKQGSL